MNDSSPFHRIVTALKSGGIAVVKTDTVYGIVACAASKTAVECVYGVKRRDPRKQCIILLNDAAAAPAYAEVLRMYSQEATTPTSVIVPTSSEQEWLLCGGDTIAYRVVRDAFLRNVIEAVGPLIAPSANPEGREPARSIEAAREYFGDSVDCYIDGGPVAEHIEPSAIVKVGSDGTIRSVR